VVAVEDHALQQYPVFERAFLAVVHPVKYAIVPPLLLDESKHWQSIEATLFRRPDEDI
jgi:hypothetical protein